MVTAKVGRTEIDVSLAKFSFIPRIAHAGETSESRGFVVASTVASTRDRLAKIDLLLAELPLITTITNTNEASNVRRLVGAGSMASASGWCQAIIYCELAPFASVSFVALAYKRLFVLVVDTHATILTGARIAIINRKWSVIT